MSKKRIYFFFYLKVFTFLRTSTELIEFECELHGTHFRNFKPLSSTNRTKPLWAIINRTIVINLMS
jgi:hypothetical protein